MDPALLELLQCPRCAGPLTAGKATSCRACQIDFPDLAGIPCLLPDPGRAIGDWKREAQRFVEFLDKQVEAFGQELGRGDLLASTRTRLERMREANRANGDRVVALFRDAGVPPDTRAKASGREFTLMQYYEQILRDWGNWGAPGEGDENEAAFELARAALGHDPIGRTLVIGSGASRLAYDLHQRHGATLTVALDYDPLLLLATNQVLFGGGLTLTEFPSDPVGLGAVAVDHALAAPAGRPAHFHLIAADAFAAPLRAGVFDTVVTPWFIDIAPADLRETLSLVHHVLAPGGRWLNQGPLSYPPEHKHAQRYSIDELMQLVAAAGFAPGPLGRTRFDYLRSRSNGRWKMMEVFTFAARKLAATDAPPLGPTDPPAWLLLKHLPVPRWPGLDGHKPEHPMLGYLAGLIDGQRTTADLAARVVADHGAKPETAVEGTRAMLGLLLRAVKEAQ